MYILIPFLIFFLLNTLGVYLSRRKFGVILPMILMISSAILYLSQIFFKTFNFGFYGIVVLASLAIVLMIIKRNDQSFIKNLFSNGFYSYLVICFVVVIVDYGRYFTNWDEFSHWGKMVKELIRLNNFYTVPESSLLVHKEYPAFIAIFEMLWCKLIGGFSECGTTMALHFLMYSFLVPWIIDKFEGIGENWIDKLFVSLLILLILSIVLLNIDGESIFSTIYVDVFVAVIYAYAIMLIIDGNLFHARLDYAALLLTMSCMVMVKQICLAFVGLTWFFYMLEILWGGEEIKNGKFRKTLLNSMELILIPMVFYFLWKHYTNGFKLSYEQFSFGRISISKFFAILMGNGTIAQQQTMKKIVNAIFTRTYTTGIFKLTYFSSMLISLILLSMFYFIFKEVYLKRDYVKTIVLFLCGRIGYSFVILILYMFCFSEGEMADLKGFARYMSSYMCAEALILMFMLIILLVKKGIVEIKIKYLLGVCGVFILLGDSTKLVKLSPQIFNGEPNYDFRVRAEEIEAKTNTDSIIFMISSTDNAAKNTFYLNFYLNGNRLDEKYKYENFSNHDDLDVEFWMDVKGRIEDCDYVYIYDVCDVVNKTLGNCTYNGLLENNSLYAVVLESGDLRLKKIEQEQKEYG